VLVFVHFPLQCSRRCPKARDEKRQATVGSAACAGGVYGGGVI
jgi:hypothetical protein